MLPARPFRALGLILLIAIAAVYFWRQPHRSTKPPVQASAALSRIPATDTDAGLEPGGGGAAASRPRTPPAGVVHEDAMALRQALADFPQSFEQAVADGKQDLARQLLTTKMTAATTVYAPALFAPLHDLMMANDFLWHDQDLVFMDWGGCLQEGERCDRAGYQAQLRRIGGDGPETDATLSCLASWEQLLPLALHPGDANPQALLQAKPLVLTCLQKAAVADTVLEPSVLEQAQYYLGFVRRVSGEAAVTQAYAELSQTAPELPLLTELLPRS